MAQPTPTIDELLPNLEKLGDIGLAEVVLVPVKALKRHHSSVPKDGTEGNEAGAGGNSSSLISPCCTNVVRLLFAESPSMTVPI